MAERHVRNLEAIRSNLIYIITPQINAKYCVFNSWVTLFLITLRKSSSAIPAVAGLAVQTYCREGVAAPGCSHEQSIRRLRSSGAHRWSPCAAGCATHPHTADNNETLTGHLLQGRGKPSLCTDIGRDNLNPPSTGVLSADGLDQIRLCTSARVVRWSWVKIQDFRKQPEQRKSGFFRSSSDPYWKTMKSTQIWLKLML